MFAVGKWDRFKQTEFLVKYNQTLSAGLLLLRGKITSVERVYFVQRRTVKMSSTIFRVRVAHARGRWQCAQVHTQCNFLCLVLFDVMYLLYRLHRKAVQRRAHDYDEKVRQQTKNTVCALKATTP